MTTDADVDYCVRQVRRHDHDRYLCGLFLPKPARLSAFVIYAFNLEIARIRETVTEAVLGEMRLAWWREAVAEAFDGQPRDHPVCRAVAVAAKDHPLDRARLDGLIDARAADLQDRPFATLADLEAYAVATSSALFQMIAALIERPVDARTMEIMRALGIAWSFSGLLRGLDFHANARRLYLPTELLRDTGADVADVFDRRDRPALRDAVRRLVGAARGHVADVNLADAAGSVRPLLLAKALVVADLRRLERAGYNPFAVNPASAPPLRLLRLYWSHLRGV